MKIRAVLFLGLALALPAALLAQASITWSTPASVSDPNEVLNTGTFVSAASVNLAPLIVNGVTFSARGTGSISFSSHNAMNWAYQPTADANYNALVNVGVHSLEWGNSYITISALTAGENYRAQLWTSTWNQNLPTAFEAGDTVQMGNTAVDARWVVGYFTATETSQSIAFRGDGIYVGVAAAVSVFQVAPIPEPSTYALLAGVAVLGFAAWRRRKTFVV